MPHDDDPITNPDDEPLMDKHTDHPDDLLPWYVNHSLDEDQRHHLEQHLRHCPRCRDEVEFLRRLRQAVQREQRHPPPGELGLKRLQRELERQAPPPRPRWLPTLAAAAVLVLGIALLYPLIPADDPAGQIQLLGESDDAGPVLQIEFAPEATEAEIRALLHDIDAVIIDGPSALGLYRIRLQDLPADDPAALEKRLRRLQQHRLIRHVARP